MGFARQTLYYLAAERDTDGVAAVFSERAVVETLALAKAVAVASEADTGDQYGGVRWQHGDIRFTAALPKTRSGKIMRRLLKEIVAGGAVKGDTTTLEDFSVVAALQASGKDEE